MFTSISFSIDLKTINESTISSATVGGGISGTSRNKVAIENILFERIRGGALSFTSMNTQEVHIKNSSFVSNAFPSQTSYNQGSAITIKALCIVENSTFAYNYAYGVAGYTAGVIAARETTKPVEIRNSVFYKNYSTSTNTNGTSPQGGGVLVVVATGTDAYVDIADCTFEDNTLSYDLISPGTTRGNTADGGGIYFMNVPGKITISGCTFLQNTAYDEGGAIAFVGATNLGNQVTNCTFYGNVSLGKQTFSDGQDGGGAIEIDNGNSPSVVTLVNNTFVKNNAVKGNSSLLPNKGGAISVSNGSIL